MAGSSFALDSLDRNDLALDLLDTEGLFGVQLDGDQLGVSDLDMVGLPDVGLSDAGPDYCLGEEEEAVSQLGWPSPVIEGHGLDSLECGDLSLTELDHQLSDAANFQEPLEEDFQKMLSEWETHIGSLAAAGEEEGPPREEARPAEAPLRPAAPPRGPLLSPATRQLPVSSGLRSPVLPRPGLSYTRVAGLGLPRAAPRASPSYLATAALSPLRSPPASPQYQARPAASSLLDTIKFSNCSSDLSTTLENQKRRMEWLESNFQRGGAAAGACQGSSKIIAAVSPGKDGSGGTARILGNRCLKDTLPRELIEKIKAASQGRKTIAIIEPVNKDRPSTAGRGRPWQPSPAPAGRWRHVGIVSPLQSHNISDHDYCSPGKPRASQRPPALSSQLNSLKQEPAESPYSVGSNTELTYATSPREPRGRDSGLESAEMSDASEDGLFDKLPPYLTSVSVQTMAAPEDHGYTRLPAYIGAAVRPAQQSLLKSSALRPSAEEAPGGREDGRAGRLVGHKGPPARREGSSGSSSGEEQGGERKRRRRSRSPRCRRTLSQEKSRSRSQSSSSSSRRRRRSQGSRLGWRGAGPGTRAPAGPPQVYDKERERKEQERRQRQQDRQRQVEERRVVYVGRIQEGTLKDDLRRRFQVFGPIVDISVHFRDHGDNYGFVTFQFKVDAYAAVEHGNDDGSQPAYDLCFGGRRAFCKEKYFDLDDVEPGAESAGDLGFDQLLEKARGGEARS